MFVQCVRVHGASVFGKFVYFLQVIAPVISNRGHEFLQLRGGPILAWQSASFGTFEMTIQNFAHSCLVITFVGTARLLRPCTPDVIRIGRPGNGLPK
jgi:hypothetical protein